MSKPPRTIGRYEIQRELGHGAMGVVYLAFDPLLKRPLAIKTMRERDGDNAFTMLRFQREAEISARLNHPNIVTVHDVGQDPEAGPFLAMEFIEGVSLAQLIQEGISTESGILLLIQGMRALQAAERAGITHRDVKPENILVSLDGRLKLMDFGIARGDGARLTQAGQIFGTPSYTAPEVLIGTEPSPASDRYAFAVTAFQMLSGVLPFESTTVGATLFRIVHEPPKFPETMGPGLRAVFERALAKDPAYRYPDLPDFLEALIGVVDLPGEVKTRLLGQISNEQGILRRAPGPAVSQSISTPISIPTPVPMAAAEATTVLQAEAPPAVGPQEEPPEISAPEPEPESPDDTPTVRTSTASMQVAMAQGRPTRKPLRWPVWVAAAGLVCAMGVWYAWTRTFHVAITSIPSGALVLLDGKEIGRTDLVRAKVPRGGGTLRFELDGYEPQERVVRRGDGPISIQFHHPPFSVQVFTDPPGAEALLNGTAVGTTPIPTLQVPGDGRQELLLRLKDYQEWSGPLERERPLPPIIKLEPLSYTVAIRTSPPGAEASLNGAPIGKTPLPKVEIHASAEQQVLLKLKNYKEWRGAFDRTRSLPNPVYLVPMIAHFAVHSEPSGADVYLDGSKVGQTPLADMAVSYLGNHSLRLTREGYQEWNLPLDPAKPLQDPIVLTQVRKPAAPAAAAADAKSKPVPPEKNKKGFWGRVFGKDGKEKPPEKDPGTDKK